MHSAYGPATPQKWWRDPASANEAQSAANNLAIPMDRVPAEPPAEMPSQGALRLHPHQHVAAFADREIRLTALEFAILPGFMVRPLQVFSRQAIVDMAYDDNIHVSDRTIDSHIRNIRATLAAAGCDAAVKTVHGVGFRLGPCEAAG